MDLYLELFGYLGTALVIVSMMMSSVVRLRLFNIAGSVISAIYATLSGAMPVAVLNAVLIAINSWQLYRFYRGRALYCVAPVGAGDASLSRLLAVAGKDLDAHFPDAKRDIDRASDAYIVFQASAAIGVFVGERTADTVHVLVDYVLPRYRDPSVARYLSAFLKERGVRTLTAPPSAPTEGEKRLDKVGFRLFKGERTLHL